MNFRSAEFSCVDHRPCSGCINVVSCLDTPTVADCAGLNADLAVVFCDSAGTHPAAVVYSCGKQCVSCGCTHDDAASISFNKTAVFYLGVIGCLIYLYCNKPVRIKAECDSLSHGYSCRTFGCDYTACILS